MKPTLSIVYSYHFYDNRFIRKQACFTCDNRHGQQCQGFSTIFITKNHWKLNFNTSSSQLFTWNSKNSYKAATFEWSSPYLKTTWVHPGTLSNYSTCLSVWNCHFDASKFQRNEHYRLIIDINTSQMKIICSIKTNPPLLHLHCQNNNGNYS